MYKVIKCVSSKKGDINEIKCKVIIVVFVEERERKSHDDGGGRKKNSG
jgi:hypothetical protein